MAASSSSPRPPTFGLSRPKVAKNLTLHNYIAHLRRLAEELAAYEDAATLRTLIDLMELRLQLLDDA
jgi:hypothetical protein